MADSQFSSDLPTCPWAGRAHFPGCTCTAGPIVASDGARLRAENERLQLKVDVALGYIRDSAKDRGERLNLAELALASDEEVNDGR